METPLSHLVHRFLEASGTALFVLSPDGQFVEANDTACQRLGRTRADLLTMYLSDIATAYPQAQWQRHWDALKSQGRLVLESIFQSINGAMVSVECELFYTVVNECEYACCMARDISELKQRQLTLLQENQALQTHLERRTADVELIKAQLREERAERLRANELIDAIIDATASQTGEPFFGAFARVLSRIFRCRYVFVCEHIWICR